MAATGEEALAATAEAAMAVTAEAATREAWAEVDAVVVLNAALAVVELVWGEVFDEGEAVTAVTTVAVGGPVRAEAVGGGIPRCIMVFTGIRTLKRVYRAARPFPFCFPTTRVPWVLHKKR